MARCRPQRIGPARTVRARSFVAACVVAAVAVAAVVAPRGAHAFLQEHESAYLAAFDNLVADSYSALADAPAALLTDCVGDGSPVPNIGAVEHVLTVPASGGGARVSASAAATQCGPGTGGEAAVCVVPAGLTLVMDGSLSVAALTVRGRLQWSDDTQGVAEQWLCAGFIAVENGGTLRLNMPDQNKRAWVYIKDNGASHPVLHSRSFGSVSSTLDVTGARLRRTWSLLARPMTSGDSSMALLHDPAEMRWRVGDRIVVAPTKERSSADAQAFRITGFGPGNAVQVGSVATDDYAAEFMAGGAIVESVTSSHRPYAGLLAAEVINLSRNVIITGDDLAHVDCDPALTSDPGRAGHSAAGCMCNAGIQRTKCTLGLHTAAMFGDDPARMSYTRVEKCGQRGILGKYCLHFHHKGACEDCVFEGNAVEYGHQRGLIVHGTHLSTSRYNVFNDVRGATVYIEDGNEMWNNIDYNVAICPWRFGDASPKHGCTVPGTPNGQADTSLNQAGFYSQTVVNNMVGNRAANSFNGMFLDAGSQGRGAAAGLVCTNKVQVGVMVGNTFHGHGRFGTYLLGDNYPTHTDQSIANNGHMTDMSLCTRISPDGTDNGLSGAIVDHVDYHNAFVGQYGAGDIQYLGHTSIKNLNNIYWKETKSFADGCAAHLAGGTYGDGNMALPDHGAFVIENARFQGNVHLEANHHCNVGVTGVLCQPMYVFSNVEWAVQPNVEWAGFLDFSTQAHPSDANFGGMFILAPPDAAAHLAMTDAEVVASDAFFPPGYISLTSHHYSYLLDLAAGGDPPCRLAAQLDGVEPGVTGTAMQQRFDGGILCSHPLRALRVYTHSLTSDSAVPLKVEVWVTDGGVGAQVGTPTAQQLVPFHQVGGQANEVMPKQGYSLPVIPLPGYSYRVSLDGGGDLPTDWVIEFSDPVFGNRWEADELHLVVAGRTCGASVSSQHDRLFMHDNSAQKFGRGACTSHPDMPEIDCDGPGPGAGGATASLPIPALNATACPDMCPSDCGRNGMCDCGLGECVCRPGFGGDDCSVSLCDAARCSGHGVCTATYLGGDLPVSLGACVCEVPWAGPLCDRNPCLDAARTCSGHGTCAAVGDTATRCDCDTGYSGAECDTTCIGTCQGGGGEYPFGCASHIDGAAELLCGPTGGCSYPSTAGGGPAGWCVYRTYGSSGGGGCADSGCYASDDCHLAGECLADGTCASETALPDGTACNSVAFGTCQAGVCTAPVPDCTPVIPNLFWFDDGTNAPALYTDDCASVPGGCPAGARVVQGYTFVKHVEEPGSMQVRSMAECQDA